jgi:hypothetical protein
MLRTQKTISSLRPALRAKLIRTGPERTVRLLIGLAARP